MAMLCWRSARAERYVSLALLVPWTVAEESAAAIVAESGVCRVCRYSSRGSCAKELEAEEEAKWLSGVRLTLLTQEMGDVLVSGDAIVDVDVDITGE